jgi:aspartate ammonia-lyase
VGEIGTAGARPGHRMEHDLLGELAVAGDAYYGVHTTRALRNFAVSGIPIGHHPELVTALAAVKQAAAAANRDLGRLTDADAAAIAQACADIRGGALHEQFVVDMIQGGAGTSTNMNANEVIVNRALELLGHPRGDYTRLHPLDQVNAGQSTNDVYPTAARIAVWTAAEPLVTQLGHLQQVSQVQADRFRQFIKIGRTQLQDAVPMTLGQELAAWAVTIGEDIDRLIEVRAVLGEVNMGGTAIGTGLNADPQFGARTIGYLRELTGIPLTVSPDLVEATQDVGAFVYFSGMLKRIAVKLSKICNDLRLLSSGPAAGFGDIILPAVQAGSSIMPGKINPVIPELVNQIAFTVIGQDLTITVAAEAGQLQLNAFEPVMVHCLLTGLRHLAAGVGLLADRCLTGITANEAALREMAANSAGLATALSPYLGHAAASELAREARASNRPVRELAQERGLLPPEVIDALLADPGRLTGTAGPRDATATRQPAGPPTTITGGTA